MPEPLTEIQTNVLRFICTSIDAGCPPTIREIGEHFGYASPNGTMCHLRALEKKGWITRRENRACGIRVAKRPPAKRKRKAARA